MFGWLTGKDIQRKNYKVSGPEQVDDAIRGTFEYQCKVSCSKLKSDYYYTVTVHDNKTTPVVKCACGRKVTLMDAPILTKRVIMGVERTSRRNEGIYINCGDGHSVHMGNTFRYELAE